MDSGQAREHFVFAHVMRLATADGTQQPHVVVTTFVVHGDRIYSAIDQKPKSTRALKRLRNIQDNPKVSALVDHYDHEDWSQLWWARADGTARVIVDDTQMRVPIDLLAQRYEQYRDNRPEGPVIEITVDRWSGWAWT